MSARERVQLVSNKGAGSILGRAMLRAFLEHRYDDARALARRIATRADLKPVDDKERPRAISTPEDPDKWRKQRYFP